MKCNNKTKERRIFFQHQWEEFSVLDIQSLRNNLKINH